MRRLAPFVLAALLLAAAGTLAVQLSGGPLGQRLAAGGRVSVVLLGYGGEAGDDANADTVMLATLDGSRREVQVVSLARDLWLPLPAWPPGHPLAAYQGKVENAYAIGISDDPKLAGRLPQYAGALGGGHLAEEAVFEATGIRPDRFVAVDLAAFAGAVDAVGGVDVCLSTPLDDDHYPDGHGGYVKGGIHFKAGCQHVDGTQALELARSRQAVEREQATDAARAARQHQLVAALERKAGDPAALFHLALAAPGLWSHVVTDLGVADALALRSFVAGLPAGAWRSTSISGQNLLAAGGCGPRTPDVLCPPTPSFAAVHRYVGALPIPAAVYQENVRLRVMSDFEAPEERSRVDALLQPLGLDVQPPQAESYFGPSHVYDFTDGRAPGTVRWLTATLGIPVARAGQPPPQLPLSERKGLVVVLGPDIDRFLFGVGPA